MIRCCSKFFISLPTRSGSPVRLTRFYVASTSRDTTQRRYASCPGSPPPRRFRKIFFTTVGLTLIGVGGVVVYAKHDPDFRKKLENYVPGSDKFISIIYQEEDVLTLDSLTKKLGELKDKILSFPDDFYKMITSGDSSKPKPKPRSKRSSEPDKQDGVKPQATVDDNKKPPAVLSESIEGIDLAIVISAKEALKLYNEALKIIQDSGSDVVDLIDKSVEVNEQKSWNEVHKKFAENLKTIETVDNILKEAGEKTKKFQSLVRSTKVGSEEDKEKLQLLEREVITMKSLVEGMKNSRLGASAKYLNKIEEARKQFAVELSILLPGKKQSDGQPKLSEDETDLFFYYAQQKLLFFQKELKKMEGILKTQRLGKAIQDSKDDPALFQELIDTEVNKVKKEIKEEFDKKVLELKAECDKDIHNQMKRQEEVHMDLLNDQLKLKEKEVERKLLKNLEDRVLEEQTRLQAELADMTGRMQGLNEAISKRALQDMKAQTSQALWSATEALYASLKNSTDKEGEIKPLAESVDAIKDAAAKGDDLVETVLATIPSVALKRGVYPEDMLRDRFLKVERVAWRVAGVPEGGASLPMLLVAWLQSGLIIKACQPIPPNELSNEPFDPSELNNYDIIQRARYWIDRGDFEQALKYMNLLKGGARSVSLDWMKEVTLLLETQQAANLLLAHASASGMIYS